MEEGESPTEAGARELLEETGYGDATRLTLIASLSPNTSTHANRVHTVLTEGVSGLAPFSWRGLVLGQCS